nr:hypothetical protein [Tanacetum cinerariifolium]
MQQKIERLQAQLEDLKGKSKDTLYVSDTQNQLSQKLENANVELEFQVFNYARENAHLKTTYKNLFDSISVSRVQTETKIACLQNELQSNIYKNAKLRTQLFKKASDHKDNTQNTSANTKFAKQPIEENFPKVGKTNALSKPVTSNSVYSPQEPIDLNNDKVIAPGMFRINPSKTSRKKRHVLKTVSASARTKPITILQPHVITKKDVNSDLNGLSSTGVDNTKTRRPQPRINTKNDRVPFASKGSRSKNKEAKVEEHHRNYCFLRITNIFHRHVIQICLWYVDSGCSKHMTGNLKLLINFVWKFMGTVRFGNDHVGVILGFDLEVAFRRNACFVRNLERVDLLKGDRLTKLYAINLHEMASASPICLMARASSTKSWLWHQRLSHLNFDTINDLAKNDLVAGLPKFKYHKEHLCPSCEKGKSKRTSHPPKPVPNSRQRLHLLHMDLCGPMITVLLQSRVIIIRTDNGTEFKNQALKEYFDSVGISHQMSSIRTPQQNGVVERRNQTLVEAARTMLIFSRAPLFLWDETIATACFTQNRSIIHRRFFKTPYVLINGRKLDISYLHVFGALCYPKNNREDIGKLDAKGDIGFFIGYSADSCAYRIYNRRTKKIMKTMNVSFDELSAMAFEQRSSKPGLQSMTSGHISSGLDLTYAPSTITTQQPSEGELDLLFEAMYDDYFGGQPSTTARTVSPVQEPQDVEELNSNAMVDGNTFVNPFANSSISVAASSSSQNVDPSNMHTFYQPYPHEFQWTKDHPLEEVIGEPSRPVLTKNQLRFDGDMCMYTLTVSTMEPKNVKEAMTDPARIDSMQEELLQFKRLDNKHISSACNNSKIDSQDVISKVVCVMCKKCLISVNHDKCLFNYVSGKNSCEKNQKAKVSVKEIQKKY